MQPQPVYSMFHPAQKPYFTVRCSPLASSVKLSFPPFYQPHPGEEMREKTTSRAVHRMCTSCHLSAQSPLTAGITAPFSGGPERSIPGLQMPQRYNACMGAWQSSPGDVCILLESGSCRVRPCEAPRDSGGRCCVGTWWPVPPALAPFPGCSPGLSPRSSHVSLRCQN